ncbi:MAG TPA: hypothetical protein VN673_13105 [Clostridia bacterium]|nr:hypothetical protein [Clostridia bacterium]
MTAEENILAQFTSLLEQGSCPRSHCSGGFLKVLQPLIDASVVVEERSGAGRRLVVRDPEALAEFTARRFPNLPTSQDTQTRVAGVARFRNSKVFASDTPHFVHVRAWSESGLIKDGQPLDAAAATARHGVFAFLLSPAYALNGVCALVENPAVFTQFEQLQLGINTVLYGHGRISTQLLDWLAAMPNSGFSLLHLPDYDPVGLSEFQRLRLRLGDRVQLHLPPDLPERFARFSNPALLNQPISRSLLASLRQSTVPEVTQVVSLIDTHNAGLEQESLLLPL